MEDIIRIAVDGPSGAGKSTIAKAVAQRLGIDYIDTGAMYRAIGYKMMKNGVAVEKVDDIQRILDATEIDFSKGDVILDGAVINDLIRTPEISRQASIFSAVGIVRAKLVDLQQKMGLAKSVVMDGRDIGTVVFPDAEYKFFITASPTERAKRRYQELLEKGQTVDYEQVLADITARDYNDTTREITPLRKAEDAIEVDTTNMTIEEVIDYICKEMK